MTGGFDDERKPGSLMRESGRGFALVEMLLIVMVASIVISLGVMLYLGQTRPTDSESCRDEARNFETAVRTWHDNDENGLWPGENAINNDPTVREVAASLRLRGFKAVNVEHLDGTQRRPAVPDQDGWTYDAKTHTTNDFLCK
jgi:competence protein ComGC